ncbi:MAG: shikimate kinase [Firmicutes bacterium]|nr:shikimate kinase [Bacillota bacterium]
MDNLTTQLALIGFMGSGKTTVGRLLAAELGYDFVDLDALIVAQSGLSIPAIFAREGEEGFRRREREALRSVAGRPRQVLATGGGIVLDPANVELLRATGLVVWLSASLAAVLSRVKEGRGRPLLAGKDPGAAAELFAAREELYRRAAHFIVDTTGVAPDEVAREIAVWFRRRQREG